METLANAASLSTLRRGWTADDRLRKVRLKAAAAAGLILTLVQCTISQAHEHVPETRRATTIRADPSGATHVQALFGIVSESDFGPALGLQYEPASRRTNVISVSLGRQVGDRLFRWPAEIVLYAGLQRFGERGAQSDIAGGTLYLKALRSFRLGRSGIPVRIGLGEGLSYADRIPSVEAEDFLPQRSARLVNYLEWSVQTSLGHWLGRPAGGFSRTVSDVYVGYTIFHRSTVFGLFASTGGGVNYLGLPGSTVRGRFRLISTARPNEHAALGGDFPKKPVVARFGRIVPAIAGVDRA